MASDLHAAMERGATVLTGSQRLPRELSESFAKQQRDQGRSVWSTPQIFPLDAFLQKCWREAILQGESEGLTLLNSAQQAALWESVVRDSPVGRSLLRVPETAVNAMNAWGLIQAYKLPVRAGEFAVSEDCEAFFAWAAEFQKRMEAGRFLDSARLPSRIAELLRDGRIERPAEILLAGFDDLAPQQTSLVEALGTVSYWDRPDFTSSPRAYGFQDTRTELQQAALWARSRLEANPEAKIGVLVPQLEALRPEVERVFREVLHPGAGFDGAPMCFHISAGAPLSERPVIHAALLILDRAQGPLDVDRMGSLLRSPYLAGAAEERSARAAYDAALRRKSTSTSAEAACPRFTRAMSALDREARKLDSERTASDWSGSFTRLLKAVGWPGDTTQNSAEYQTVRTWNRLLSTFATLDAVAGRMDFGSAVAKLRKLAEASSFQPEDVGAPVEVLGLFEASGLSFDHLWVSGLHDEAMPQPARPNPFLPIALQRRYNIQHSSAERELEYNTKLLARLIKSARQVILSYPEWEGDQPLGPSPLLAPYLSRAANAPKVPLWRDALHAAAAAESFEDSTAPEVAGASTQSGGTWFLRDMAACPFRAYAKYRLGARELEDPELGISSRERGTAVHKALEFLWTELKTHAALCALSPDETQDLIARSLAAAFQGRGGLGYALEKVRLTEMLAEWLRIERARPPFTVIEIEKEMPVLVGGLKILTRIDRVDQLPDGRHIIIDYKTGVVKRNAWADERLDEPQVPLYCVNDSHPVAAAAFAQLRAGEMQFRGVSENNELGAIKPMTVQRHFRLAEVLRSWDSALHALAERFRTGAAQVDPKQKDSCEYCPLTALCRISDE